jgi:hypothetical protein
MKRLLVLTLLCFSTFANAYTHPQFFFQADEGDAVLTPRITYLDRDFQLNNFSSNAASTDVALEFEYGVLDWLSLGANWGFEETNIENPTGSHDYSGMRDFSVYARAFYGEGPFKLRYGAAFDFGSIAEEDASGRRSNSYSGRYQFQPYVGFDYRAGSSIVGARVQTELLIGDAKTELATGGERTETGGNTTAVAAFYEYHQDAFLLGGSLEYRTTTDAEGVEPGGGTTDAEFVSVFLIEAYGAFQVSENFDLIPILTYGTTTDDQLSGSDINEFDIYGVQLDARFTF